MRQILSRQLRGVVGLNRLAIRSVVSVVERLYSPFRNKAPDERYPEWERDGYLVLKGLFSAAEIDAYTAEVDEFIRRRTEVAADTTIDLLEGELAGRRMRLRDVPDSSLGCGYKLNDLFLEQPACRKLSLDPRLRSMLEALLDGQPLIINSLNFIKGSQQAYHFDTYYMPPPVRDRMVVASI